MADSNKEIDAIKNQLGDITNVESVGVSTINETGTVERKEVCSRSIELRKTKS